MTATELADAVGVLTVVTLWTALAWRAAPALRRPNQRGLWVTVLAATVALTLFQPRIVAGFTDLGVGIHTVALTRNLIGVLSAGLVLLFIADSTRTRHLRAAVLVGLVTALGSLLALDLLGVDQTAAPGPAQGPATCSSLYWLILAVAHLLGDAVAVAVCWPYSRRTGDRDLVRSLRLFALGSVLALVFWSGYLVSLYVRAPGLLPYLSVIISVHGLFRAASLLVPTAAALARSATALSTVWRLWPLWRDLVAAVPQVTLAGPQRTRVREVLRPRSSWALQAHRQIIETYDALLDLQAYVGPDAYDTAYRRAEAAGLRGERRTAAALAGALGEARTAKLTAGTRTVTPPAEPPAAPGRLPGLDRGSPATLLALARTWPPTTAKPPAQPDPLPARRS
ncbi:MAB_1171c family putative transporter [Streptomyces tropicalis]|uniref:Regulator component n=1 Tax=Streptomyces tropicalis TaxID=3034234 RepID=A0ABT6A180_9ACTN|nr:MAB_1171c family putative transporter [Streptomyces tropicalis]MDF3298404.1 regulator component [Streptomyces tropicalis]